MDLTPESLFAILGYAYIQAHQFLEEYAHQAKSSPSCVMAESQ